MKSVFNPRQALVTGARGFVGRALLPALDQAGVALRPTSRAPLEDGNRRYWPLDIVAADTDWPALLDGCDAVIHLASQVPRAGIAEAHYRQVNEEGVVRLVRAAEAAGVKRLIHVSSIYAVASKSQPEAPVDDGAAANPDSTYGASKLAGEAAARDFAGTGRSVTILRPPLIYGAGAGGQWRRLMQLAAKGVPLPLKNASGARSLIGVDAFAGAILACLSRHEPYPDAPAYALADDGAVNAGAMIASLREGMGLPQRLFPLPQALLTRLLAAAGAAALTDTMVLDGSRFRDAFAWQPAQTLHDGIAAAGRTFKADRS